MSMSMSQKDQNLGIRLEGFSRIEESIARWVNSGKGRHKKKKTVFFQKNSERGGGGSRRIQNFLIRKQARKSSEDTQVSEYARFEKKLGPGKLQVKEVWAQIFLLIFSLNWFILFFLNLFGLITPPPLPSHIHPTNFRKSYPDPKCINRFSR